LSFADEQNSAYSIKERVFGEYEERLSSSSVFLLAGRSMNGGQPSARTQRTCEDQNTELAVRWHR